VKPVDPPQLLDPEFWTPVTRRPLVAVLPFGAPSEDPDLKLLATELADTLRDNLARSPEVGAILISSDFLARAPEHALELICRQLHVGFLISGRCHRVGPHESLYVELAETRDWHVVRADFFGGNARQLLVPGSEEMARLTTTLCAALVLQRVTRSA
jgi:TolB-like protein